MHAQIQGLEDMLGSFQGAAVDGVPAEPSASVPNAAQTYTRIIARARNDAGGHAAPADAQLPLPEGVVLIVRCASALRPHMLSQE